MKTLLTLALLGTAALAAPAGAQTTTTTATAPTLSLFAAPAYLGRATAVTAASPNLTVNARSARVRGSWEVCSEPDFGGECQTLTASQPLANLTVRSARPTPAPGTTGATTTSGTTASASTSASARLDLDALDTSGGTTGQDVEFFAQPSFGTDQVSAGTNDRVAADAFCKRAGATSSVYAGRGRAQVSNLIDIATATRVRGFPLRDVLCRR